MSRRHWPPRVGEEVFDARRERAGLSALGTIYSVDREWSDPEEGTVFVHFKGVRVTRFRRRIFWHGHLVTCMEFRINGIRYCADEVKGRKEQYEAHLSYEFWELDGNWSSREGGEGCWSLE